MKKSVELIINSESLFSSFDWILRSKVYQRLLETDEIALEDLYLYFKELYFNKIENIIPHDRYYTFVTDPGRFSLSDAYFEIFQESIKLIGKQISIKNYKFKGNLDYDENAYREISFTSDDEEFITVVEHSNGIHINPVVTTLNDVKEFYDIDEENFFVMLSGGGVAYVSQKEFLTLISHRHIYVEHLDL